MVHRFDQQMMNDTKASIDAQVAIQPLLSPTPNIVFVTFVIDNFTILSSVGFAAMRLIDGQCRLSTDAEISDFFYYNCESIGLGRGYLRRQPNRQFKT
jgi:hypothetical protein